MIYALLLSLFAFFQCPAPPAFISLNTLTVTETNQFSFSVNVVGFPAPVVTETGGLPSGVTFSAGSLSGTAAAGTAGVYPLTFIASNGTLPNAVQTFLLTVNPSVVVGGLWKPALVTSWQWQLSSVPLASQLLNVQMYDVDGENATAALVTTMHNKGIKAVCYFSAGSYENWRSDKNRFLVSDKGRSNGWAGESWVDIRSSNVRSIMADRIAMCKSKGFDAIESDNIDGWQNNTGFPLTATDQISYNRFLADTAHSFGLSATLKNDNDQVNQLLPYFDFGLVEECVTYSECNSFKPFVQAGKAVFAAEYRNRSNTCSTLNSLNYNGAIFDLDLSGKRTACR